jgi:predicted nucleotidyltransferase
MPQSKQTSPRDHSAVIIRFVEACSADDRIVAAFLGGSFARGEEDDFSDLDLCAIVSDDAFDDVVASRDRLIERLGEPLFLQHLGDEAPTFAILSDGTDIELHVVREGELDSIRSGPHRVLMDQGGILTNARFPWPELDRDAQLEALRATVTWFWHDLSHFTAAIGRDQLWWAAGQLEVLRASCVTLARLEQQLDASPDEPYWKLDHETSTGSLDVLASTFVALERAAMLNAGTTILAFFRSHAPSVAASNGIAYPVALDRLVGGRLDELRG